VTRGTRQIIANFTSDGNKDKHKIVHQKSEIFICDQNFILSHIRNKEEFNRQLNNLFLLNEF
jgi:hypothetical protein